MNRLLVLLLVVLALSACGDGRPSALDRAATPDGELPPLGKPSCVAGAVDVGSAEQAASELADGHDVCVTADIGDLSLSGGDWGSDDVESLGTTGAGRIGKLDVNGPRGLTSGSGRDRCRCGIARSSRSSSRRWAGTTRTIESPTNSSSCSTRSRAATTP